VCGEVPEHVIEVLQQVVEHQPATSAPLHADRGRANVSKAGAESRAEVPGASSR
jgi:hypothetical protein